jgi:O-antigen ligase
MLTYLGISGVTVMYSAAPIVTAAKIFELGTGLAVVAAIALHPEASQQIRRTIGLLIGLEAALLVVAVVGFFALPSRFAQLQPRPGFISDYTMGSPYAHSNALSSIGAIVGAYALARVLPKKPDRRTSAWWWILAGFGIAGTILASGRQGVVLWLVSAFVLLLIHRRFALFAVVLPAAAFALTSYGEEIWTALLRNRPTTFASLTGRTHWWSAAIDAWADHPWTGYGYGVGGRFVALESIGRGTTSNIHSGYFEALVGVGLIGLLPLMVAILVALAWTTGGLLRHRETHLTILIVPLILRTAVAQGFGAWLNFEFLLFALLVILADCSSIEALERSRQQRLPPLPSRQLAGVRGS